MQNTSVRATRPYGGYEVVRSDRIDTELTDTDKGKPAGEYLRRFWQPVALSSDLKAFAVPLQILGEDLVLFRDRSGDVGLLQKTCAHRGASLEFGLIVEHGIRCAYHGWHFATDGSILEAPAEHVPGTVGKRLWQGAYPTREFHGLIFAYMGPPDEIPPFPRYDFMLAKDEQRMPFRHVLPTNWLHVRENAQDPIHLSFLHTMFSVQQFGSYAAEVAIMRAHETPIGQIINTVRRVGDEYYARINEMILPNIAKLADSPAEGRSIPANKAFDPNDPESKNKPLKYKRRIPSTHGLGITQICVPLTNAKSMWIGWHHHPADEDPEVIEAARVILDYGQKDDRPYEDRQRNPGDFEVLVSQSPDGAYSRDNEMLTTADVGIVMYRKQLREGIRAVQAGQQPKNMVREDGPPVPTYAHSLFKPAAPKGSDADELAKKVEFEREVAEMVLGNQAPKNKRILVPY
jgi:phenylpropionate dioxygenase-like ring-hydroxylating dioxygenase large terminal subunit